MNPTTSPLLSKFSGKQPTPKLSSQPQVASQPKETMPPADRLELSALKAARGESAPSPQKLTDLPESVLGEIVSKVNTGVSEGYTQFKNLHNLRLSNKTLKNAFSNQSKAEYQTLKDKVNFEKAKWDAFKLIGNSPFMFQFEMMPPSIRKEAEKRQPLPESLKVLMNIHEMMLGNALSLGR